MTLAITGALGRMSMFWSDKLLLVYGRMPSHSVLSESNYDAKLTSFLLTQWWAKKSKHTSTCGHT